MAVVVAAVALPLVRRDLRGLIELGRGSQTVGVTVASAHHAVGSVGVLANPVHLAVADSVALRRLRVIAAANGIGQTAETDETVLADPHGRPFRHRQVDELIHPAEERLVLDLVGGDAFEILGAVRGLHGVDAGIVVALPVDIGGLLTEAVDHTVVHRVAFRMLRMITAQDAIGQTAEVLTLRVLALDRQVVTRLAEGERVCPIHDRRGLLGLFHATLGRGQVHVDEPGVLSELLRRRLEGEDHVLTDAIEHLLTLVVLDDPERTHRVLPVAARDDPGRGAEVVPLRVRAGSRHLVGLVPTELDHPVRYGLALLHFGSDPEEVDLQHRLCGVFRLSELGRSLVLLGLPVGLDQQGADLLGLHCLLGSQAEGLELVLQTLGERQELGVCGSGIGLTKIGRHGIPLSNKIVTVQIPLSNTGALRRYRGFVTKHIINMPLTNKIIYHKNYLLSI